VNAIAVHVSKAEASAAPAHIEQRIAKMIAAAVEGDALPTTFYLRDGSVDIRIEVLRRAGQ
jgi:sulfur carrier protein ThiS